MNGGGPLGPGAGGAPARSSGDAGVPDRSGGGLGVGRKEGGCLQFEVHVNRLFFRIERRFLYGIAFRPA